jgi:hexosaminidase
VVNRSIQALFLAVAALVGHAPAAATEPAIIPRPLHVVERTGSVVVADGTPIVAAATDGDVSVAARYLADLATRLGGPRLRVVAAAPPTGSAIHFVHRAGLAAEGYALDVDAHGATIIASTRAGLLYGAVSLAQMLSAAPDRRLAALHIEDAPRLRWRGLVLDSVRHFQSPAEVERVIDWMALHKLNRLQWHLADDQGWRIAIPGYPRLESVAAWRTSPPATGPAGRYGGIYTRDDIRRILALAAERGVTVVPEIEMPGHSTAAILAYPELGFTPHGPANLGDWGIFSSIYGVDQPTFTFLHRVLDEVMARFPSSVIAIGGDEAVHTQWRESPAVQARMRALGLKDENALQAWFVRRIGAYLHARGRRLAGWDEILDGDAAPADAVILSWHGAQVALAAARAGRDVVMVTEPTLYLDYRQSALPSEPPGRSTVVRLADVYAYDPGTPAATSTPPLDASTRDHIIGVQGALWTEYVTSDAGVEAKALPRAAAIAEIGWTAPDRKDWPSFVARLPAMLARYRALGLAAADTAFAVQPTTMRMGQRLRVALDRQLALGDIRYTLDGSSPGPASARYEQPLNLPLAGRLRAASFAGEQRLSRDLDLPLDPVGATRRLSQDLTLCNNGIPLNLPGRAAAAGATGPAYYLDIRHPCWIYRDADTADLTHLAVRVAALPFGFQFGAEPPQQLPPTTSPAGELTVRRGCEGPVLATVPLAGIPADGAEHEVVASLPPSSGRGDLCLSLARPTLAPLWALAAVELRP